MSLEKELVLSVFYHNSAWHSASLHKYKFTFLKAQWFIEISWTLWFLANVTQTGVDSPFVEAIFSSRLINIWFTGAFTSAGCCMCHWLKIKYNNCLLWWRNMSASAAVGLSGVFIIVCAWKWPQRNRMNQEISRYIGLSALADCCFWSFHNVLIIKVWNFTSIILSNNKSTWKKTKWCGLLIEIRMRGIVPAHMLQQYPSPPIAQNLDETQIFSKEMLT